jgi:integrase
MVQGTKKDAQRELRKILTRVDNGLPAMDDLVTFRDFIDDFLRQRSTRVRALTLYRYRNVIRLYMLPALGSVQLAKIQPRHLEALYQEQLEQGLSASTVHQTHRIIKAAFTYAVRTGRLVRNPAELVEPPSVKRKEMATLTLEEARKLIAYVSGGDSYEIAMYTALTTGLRRGELIGLKWGDINFAHKYLSLQRSVVRVPGEGFVVSEPKSHASRRPVELGEPDLKVLSGHRARQAEARLKVGLTWPNEDWVFTRQFGEHLNPDALSKKFPQILEEMGLPRVRLHDLRHTHATLMMEADINREVVKSRLGHSSISITSDTYTHVSTGLQRDGVESFWNMMEG